MFLPGDETRIDSPSMNTSVFYFNEKDPKPYPPRKDIFKTAFNHGRTPYGNQEKCGKSLGTTSRKKRKIVTKTAAKYKSGRAKTAPKARGNGSPSASELIEADDSDSESNQDRRKLDMRFGGALGISRLNNCRDEDHVAEQSREVVIHGEQLIFLEQWYSLPEFIFAADGIVLKIQVSGVVCAVKWALHEVESFRSCFDQEKGIAVIELDLTEHGARTFLQELGQSDSYCSCHTLSSSLWAKSSWEEDLKEITSLSDRYKSIWSPIKEDMSEFFQASISRRRNRATSDNWFDLIFPTKEDQDAVTVTQYDFQLLNPDQFLSDTIIDFYIKYLQSQLSEDENKRFYFYNSFFFRKLTEVDKNFQHGLEKSKSSFERVKRWTAKINIFEKDYLFIPIMQSAHWSLVIVCHPGTLSAGYRDTVDSKAPLILHFDSLEGCHTCVEEPIRNYLIEAWNEKNGHSESPESLSTLKFVAMKAPQQTNYCDCGLFLLHYVELFIEEVLKEGFIGFATDDWFNPAEASSKRAKLQSLIECLKAKELADKPEKSCYRSPSSVTGPPDGAWSAQRSVSFEDEYLKATNLFPGNMLDQACCMLVSYPQQYQNNLQVCAHTKLGHDYLESGLDFEQELQQCFGHSQSQAPNGKLSMLCLRQQGAVSHVQDVLLPNCTCVDEEDGAVHDFDLTLPHDSIEGTNCNENLEGLHALNRDVAINLPEEFAEGLDNDGSRFTMVEENDTFTKSGSFENNRVNARALFGFSLHYDDKRVSDMGISTVQKVSLDERPYAHAFQKGSNHKQYTSNDSLAEHFTICNIEPDEGILDTKFGDLEQKIGLINSAGDVCCLEGKETINEVKAASKRVEGRFLESEDVSVKMEGGVTIQGESLTEQKSSHTVSHNSSPSVVERTGSLDISSDGVLTPIAADGSREGKRRRGFCSRNAHQSESATRRITRSASKLI